MSVFHLPDLGEGLQEAEIVTWHVSVGDHVVADQPLVSVETDKAVVEIPSPESGHVTRLFGAAGDIIEIGDPLVELDAGVVDTGAVVGEIPDADRAETPPGPSPASGPGVTDTTRGAASTVAAPAVRALAGRLGVDLASVAGTGPGGAVTRTDVEAAVGAPGAEPLRGVRRAMAANMARAHAEVVPTTVTDEADVGTWPVGTDITLRLVRAVGVACAAEPALNAWFLGRDRGRVLHRAVDLGLAVDTPDGLIVPVLRDVANRTPEDLGAALGALTADVRARTVPPVELRGATITLSNFGTIGGRHAALVVVPPQVAIVGAGRIRNAVVAVDGVPTVRPVLPISLTFDHRVVMGGEATRFLVSLLADLTAPT